MVTGPGAVPASLAAVCAVLAVAAATVPAGPGAARLAALWPRPRRRLPRPRRAAAVPVIGALGGLMVLGPAGGAAGLLLAETARRRRARGRAAATASATAAQLADALQRMVDELRTGRHPAAVLNGPAADGPLAAAVLAGAAGAAELGDGVPGALRRTAAARAAAGQADLGADLERVALAWSLAERHGVPLADLLAGAQRDIRWRARFAATVRAQLAGPRATAAVLTGLPVLGVGLGQLLGADPVGVLRGGWLGQLLLVLGVGLGAAGMAWSERILRSAVPR